MRLSLRAPPLQNPVGNSPVLHIWYMPRPFHSSWFDHPITQLSSLCYKRREEHQLDAPECDLSHNFPHPGRTACCSAPNSRPPATMALHTISGNNTSIVSSSWWWAFMCPKHAEQIISAIKHSVASSWFSSLSLYYDARTNIQQIRCVYSLSHSPVSWSRFGQNTILSTQFSSTLNLILHCLLR